jgi:hypothetical protein
MWTNHHTKPPNLTLGGSHMGQTLLNFLGFVTKIQLHVTHATTNLCSCLRQVAHDIQLHVTLHMQHVYTVLIYMFIHTYQSKCSCILCVTFLATNQNVTRVKIKQLAYGHVSLFNVFVFSKLKIH